MNKHIRLDPRIKGIIAKLNEVGFETLFSCAGHKTKSGMEAGYITFRGELDKEILTQQLNLLGLELFKIEYEKGYAVVPCTTVRFPGLGGTKGYKKNLSTSKIELTEEQAGFFLLFNRNLSRLGIHHFSREAIKVRYALSKAFNGEEITKSFLPDIWD